MIELVGEANDADAGLLSACVENGICLRTLKRWRCAFVGDGVGKDRRKGSLALSFTDWCTTATSSRSRTRATASRQLLQWFPGIQATRQHH
jgi:hypothetical protein